MVVVGVVFIDGEVGWEEGVVVFVVENFLVDVDDFGVVGFVICV